MIDDKEHARIDIYGVIYLLAIHYILHFVLHRVRVLLNAHELVCLFAHVNASDHDVEF